MRLVRYMRHGSPVELRRVVFLDGSDRRLVGTWVDPRGKVHCDWDCRRNPTRRVWHVLVRGKRVDTALTLQRARRRAEYAARRALLEG